MPFTDIDLYLVHRNASRMRDIRNRKEMTVRSTLGQASKLLRLAGRDVMNREPLPKTPPELKKRSNCHALSLRILPEHVYERARQKTPIKLDDLPSVIPKGGSLANSTSTLDKKVLN
jgi:hypothetical protein